MSRVRHLGTGFAWMLVGSAVLALAQWVLVVVMARRGSARVVGDWTLALAVTAPAFIFAQLKLRAVQSADAAEVHPWGDYVVVRVASMGAAWLVALVLGLVLYDADTTRVILLVALSKAVEGMCDLLYGRLQRGGELRQVGVALIRRAVLMLAAGASAFWLAPSAVSAASGVLLGHALALAFDWSAAGALARIGPEGVDGFRAARLARRSLPLGVSTALGSLQGSVPRLVLNATTGRETVGVLGALSYPLMAGGLVISTLANVALPNLGQRMASGDVEGLRRTVARLCATGAALATLAVGGALLVGRQVLGWIYPSGYAAHAADFAWLALAAGVGWTVVFLGTALDAMRNYRAQPWVSACSLSLVVLLCWRLAPTQGIRGVAWGITGGAMVEGVLLGLVARHTWRQAAGRLNTNWLQP